MTTKRHKARTGGRPKANRFRIVANTRQPREARTTAVASPMPLDVPVISTERMSEIPIRHLYDDSGL